MVEFSIRCHPSVPLEPAEVEAWLEARARDLRAAWPTATIRLFRLTQPLAGGVIEVGWLLEAEVPAEDPDVQPWLCEALRDMRLLGFHPVLAGPRPGRGRQGEIPLAGATPKAG
jgi:hypothetical protein